MGQKRFEQIRNAPRERPIALLVFVQWIRPRIYDFASQIRPLQGPSLIHYVSSRNRPRNCRFGSIIPLSLSLSHFREEINRWPGSKKRLINGEIIERKITTNSPRKRNGRSRYFRLQDSYLTYKGDESLSQNSPLPMISILPNFLQLPRAERAGRRLLSFLLLWEEEACTLLRYRWDPKSQDDFVSRSTSIQGRIYTYLSHLA